MPNWEVSASNRTQAFMSIAYEFLPIMEGMSFSNRKAYAQAASNSAGDPPTDGSDPPTSGRGKWPTKQSGRIKRLYLPPLKPWPSANGHLSICSCPLSILLPVGTPLPFPDLLSGRNVNDWSYANRHCFMAIWVPTEWGRSRRFSGRVPAWRQVQVSSCQGSWSKPSALCHRFLSFCALWPVPSSTLLHRGLSESHLILKAGILNISLAELPTRKTHWDWQHCSVSNMDDKGLISFICKESPQINEANRSNDLLIYSNDC